MSDKKRGSLFGTSDGGVSGKHVDTSAMRYLVAPATDAEFNTILLPLNPIACWRLDDIRFAFDSSFVTVEAAAELKILLRLREKHKDKAGLYPPLSIFGHADPTGTDDYNKALSGRRAKSVYAVLISRTQTERAVSLWQEIAQVENWSDEHRQAMQTVTGLPATTGATELYQAYFAKLCPANLNLTPRDFLARGADPHGKGDYQGCSSFNPLLIFSRESENRYAHGAENNNQPVLRERDGANASNRRVLAFLFRPKSVVVPSKWPCPRASEGKGGCQARFWSDGEKRRTTHLAEERRYEKSKDTFACRFYDRLSSDSPCEQHIVFEYYPFST